MYEYRKGAYTPEEVGKKLDVNGNTVRKWVRDCDLEASRVGPLILIRRKKLEKWLRDVYPRLFRQGKVRVRIDVEHLDLGS